MSRKTPIHCQHFYLTLCSQQSGGYRRLRQTVYPQRVPGLESSEGCTRAHGTVHHQEDWGEEGRGGDNMR